MTDIVEVIIERVEYISDGGSQGLPGPPGSGSGAAPRVIQASEALDAGDYVNIHDGGNGTFKVRQASASTKVKPANGYVLTDVAEGADATVYFSGVNDKVAGQVPGDVFLQTFAGQGGPHSPEYAGNISQNIGCAISATAVSFQAARPITIS